MGEMSKKQEENILAAIDEIGYMLCDAGGELVITSNLQEKREDEVDRKVDEIKEESGWKCKTHMNPEECDKQCIEEMLSSYLSHDTNYVVGGAKIQCSMMSDRAVEIYYTKGKIIISTEGGKAVLADPETGANEVGVSKLLEIQSVEEIRRLSAVHALKQSAMGSYFATVGDCICARNAGQGSLPSIVSLGNCKIARASDYDKLTERNGIEKRGSSDTFKEGIKYGTCYCLIDPDSEWVNPFLTQSDVDSDSNSDSLRHKPFEWYTSEGMQEGITMLSTLLCKRGGIITVEWSGQESYEPQEMPEPVEEEVYEPQASGISAEGLKALMELEILNKSSLDDGYLVIENGKLIGIKPHLAGDGLVTVGFGDCLMDNDLQYYTDNMGENAGFLSDDADEYKEMQDTVIPIDICYRKFIMDVEACIPKVVNDFEAKGVRLSQEQLDAVVIMKYQAGAIGEDAVNAIAEGATRDELYDIIIKKHGTNGKFEFRTGVEMNIFFGDGYEVAGGLDDLAEGCLNVENSVDSDVSVN